MLIGIPAKRRILFIWEPAVVAKRNYSARFLRKFSFVFAASPIWADATGGSVFFWPQTPFRDNLNLMKEWELRNSEKLVMVQGNKFSVNPHENYSLRRAVLSSKEVGASIDLFGPSWNLGSFHDLSAWLRSYVRGQTLFPSLRSLKDFGKKYENYLGEVEDKFKVLRKYRYCIVIENSSDFVSEKLFDAVSVGCIPLYVGPSLRRFGFTLPDILICKEDAIDISERFKKLKRMNNSELIQLSLEVHNSLKPIAEKYSARKILGDLGNEISKIISP
jgi:hypothetical protein